MEVTKSKIMVEVLLSTVEQMKPQSAKGDGRSKWFALNEYDNHADCFNAMLAHAQNEWGEKSPSLRLTHINTSMPHLGLINERGVDADVWLLMEMGDIEQVEIVEAYIAIHGRGNDLKTTIQDAIDLFQGRHETDESCVEQYISEFGSIREADDEVSPYLTKDQYTTHFMKNISKSNGFYFNN